MFSRGFVLSVPLLAAKQKAWFDFDGWIEAGLADGTLTIGPTEDPDRVQTWKEENEIELNADLEQAIARVQRARGCTAPPAFAWRGPSRPPHRGGISPPRGVRFRRRHREA